MSTSQHELISSHAAGHVAGAQSGGEALGHRSEHVVSDGVTPEVVDLLEDIDVERHEDDREAAALRPSELRLELLRKGPAVEQSGERVAEGERLELRLVRPALAQRLVEPADLGLGSTSTSTGEAPTAWGVAIRIGSERAHG